MAEESITLRLMKEAFAPMIIETHSFRGDDTIVIKKEALFEVAKYLKETPELDYNFLMDLTVVDYLKYKDSTKKHRFEVVYHFYSLEHNHRVRIKVPVEEEDPTVDSLVPIWSIANWLEREAWDMFGIRFNNHPNLRRILMYEEFQGHPLRKDYPLRKRQPLIGPVN